MPRLPPAAPPSLLCGLRPLHNPRPHDTLSPAQALIHWVKSGQSLDQPAGGGLSCPLWDCLWTSEFPSLSTRSRGATLVKPECIPRGGNMSFPPYPFWGLSPKREGQGLPTLPSGASRSWTCLFPWTEFPSFPKTRPQCPLGKRPAGWG